MPNKDPAFLFYPQDFLVGTVFFSFEQKGKYIEILSLMHSNGGFLSKEKLKRFLDFNKKNDKEVLDKFNYEENKGYFNQRLNKEMVKRNKYKTRQKENANRRWHPEQFEEEKIEKPKIKKEIKHKYGQYNHVLLTDKQFEKLKIDFPKQFEFMIKNLDEYLENKNVSYKNHNLTMRKWKTKNNNNNNQVSKQGEIDWEKKYGGISEKI